MFHITVFCIYPSYFFFRLGMKYLETSAKTGHNIAEAFTCLAETLVIKRREENGGEDPVSGLTGGKQGSLTLDGCSRRTVDGETDLCGWNKGVCSTLWILDSYKISPLWSDCRDWRSKSLIRPLLLSTKHCTQCLGKGLGNRRIGRRR